MIRGISYPIKVDFNWYSIYFDRFMPLGSQSIQGCNFIGGGGIGLEIIGLIRGDGRV
jgi:hypothetical protein